MRWSSVVLSCGVALTAAAIGSVSGCSGSDTGFTGPSQGVTSGSDDGTGAGGSAGRSSGSTGAESGSSEDSGGGHESTGSASGSGSAHEDMDAGTGTPVGNGSCTPPSPQYLPKVNGTCPDLATGMITVSGQQVQIFAGSGAPGPLLLYWHGTGSVSAEVEYTFGQAQIQAVMAAGGVVASFTTSTTKGTTTGNGVWFTGDFDMADQIVACGIQQQRVDPCRIYVSGASAGGLQATWMAYARSGYLAGAAPLSGGVTGYGSFILDPPPQDSTHVVPGMATHGAPGQDVVVIDFSVASATWEADIAKRGGFSIDCNTGGGHVSGPPQVSPALWQFMKDHPFKVSPEPYQGKLPSVFPSYCQIGPRAPDGGAP